MYKMVGFPLMCLTLYIQLWRFKWKILSVTLGRHISFQENCAIKEILSDNKIS